MSGAAQRDGDLTPEELAQLERALPLLQRLLRRAATAEVDAPPDPKVRRQATDEDFAEIQRIRRRKGLSRG